MDQYLEKLITQAPATFAVIVVVILFLRFEQAGSKRREDALKRIGKDCHDHQTELCDKMDVVVSENSQAIRENTTMLGRNLEALNKLNGGH